MLERFEAMIAGASGDDLAMLRKTLPDWREGGYPYKNLLSRKNFEKHKIASKSNC